VADNGFIRMLGDFARLQRRGRPGFTPDSLFVGSEIVLPTTNARRTNAIYRVIGAM
jgi:hypothetical protein